MDFQSPSGLPRQLLPAREAGAGVGLFKRGGT
jgi:hypothetical protein